MSGSGLQVQERHGYWNESGEGLPSWSGTGARDIQGEAKRTGPVHPGMKKRAQGETSFRTA